MKRNIMVSKKKDMSKQVRAKKAKKKNIVEALNTTSRKDASVKTVEKMMNEIDKKHKIKEALKNVSEAADTASRIAAGKVLNELVAESKKDIKKADDVLSKRAARERLNELFGKIKKELPFSAKSDDDWADNWKPEDEDEDKEEGACEDYFPLPQKAAAYVAPKGGGFKFASPQPKRKNIPPPGYTENCSNEIAEELARKLPNLFRDIIGPDSSLFDELFKLDKLGELVGEFTRKSLRESRNLEFANMIYEKANTIFLTALDNKLNKIEQEAFQEPAAEDDVGEE